jgi:hypothetical protein
MLGVFFTYIDGIWAGQISLAWDANTQAEVAGYKVYYGTASGSYIGNLDVGLKTTAVVTGLTEGVNYFFAVVNYNASRTLESEVSNEVSGIVPVSPTIDGAPPVLLGSSPSGVLPAGTRSTNMVVNTNENSTCRFSYSSGLAYSGMQFNFSTTGGLSHSTPITGMLDNSSYNYYVRCQDLAGNASSSDYIVSFSVAAATDTNIDIELPLANITYPMSGGHVSAGAIVNIMANASDNNAVLKVEFYVNGILKCTDNSADYSCTWAVPKRYGKTYRLKVKAYDAAGNIRISEIVTVTSN